MPSGRWACKADRVFDGETVRDGAAVLIEDDAILDVVPAAEIPHGISVLSFPGGTILPGLIDLHTHFMRWEGALYLAYGITAIRDTANPLDWILARRAESGREPWPCIFCTGPALDGPVAHWPEISWACRSEADAQDKVRALADAGVDGIKLYVKLPGEWIPGMVKAAHAAGLPVLQHCTAGVLASARAGVDEFFHLDGLLADIWPDCPHGGWLEVWGRDGFEQTLDRQQRVADEIARLGLVTTPTLVVWDWFRRWRLREQPLPEAAPFLPRALADWFAVGEARPDDADLWARGIERALQFLGLLLERKATILPGTDVPWTYHLPGHLLWRELAFLTAAGMSPLDALRAATSRAARALRTDRLGRLAPRCLADLVIVSGDPTQRIPDPPDVTCVIKGGQIHQPSELFSAAGEYDLLSEPMGQAFKRFFVDERN